LVTAFLHVVVKINNRSGLFRNCKGYYAMVEAQGRGMLHMHMLLWVEGHPNPNELQKLMVHSKSFQNEVIMWLEDLIKCELLGDLLTDDTQHLNQLQKPQCRTEEYDPQLEQVPQLSDHDANTFANAFQLFVHRLAIKCNWHEHTLTCFKHLQAGGQLGDGNCHMQINGSVCTMSSLDDDTKAILLRHGHPCINNYNDIVIYLMQCNMDIKFVGSGVDAKALTYYISDYITKNDLQVHVGLQAIQAVMESHVKRFMNNVDASVAVHKKNLLMKMINTMMGKHKISHQQVMSHLVWGGDYYTSHQFHTICFHNFIDIAHAHEQHVDGFCICPDHGLPDCPDNLYGETCLAFTSPGSISVVSDTIDYLM
ncbi:hypothetical protein F5J12DRAFT_725566, partial [Pisolithus orientalis]|uniref:uncharacterized protein n=1 Tax=Pisolithus orientalis TaxID=936130 RepID=UPI00222475F3